MSKIYIPIDSKSLFYNIFNDNKKGHTPTVCTPIFQGRSLHEANKIFLIPNKQIDFNLDLKINDYLNSSSKSTTKITNIFLFDKITVNGIKVNNNDNFCMFVKEEIDPNKDQFGRKKLHYPISIKYEGTFHFNNKDVFNEISNALKNYAFVIKGFYYDYDSDTLDFDAIIVGYNHIPYSKVFIKTKEQVLNYLKVHMKSQTTMIQNL